MPETLARWESIPPLPEHRLLTQDLETEELFGYVLPLQNPNRLNQEAIVALTDAVVKLEACMDSEGLNPRDATFLQKLYIFVRDGQMCAYCLAGVSKASADHLIPYSRGGLTRVNNLVCSCLACNIAKGTATPEQFLERLHQPDGYQWRALLYNDWRNRTFYDQHTY